MCAIEYIKISRRFFKIENKPQNTLLIEINIFSATTCAMAQGRRQGNQGALPCCWPCCGGLTCCGGATCMEGTPETFSWWTCRRGRPSFLLQSREALLYKNLHHQGQS